MSVNGDTDRIDRLERRVDNIDATARMNAVLAVQLQELSKDVSALERTLEGHRSEHAQAAAAAVSSRRWLVGVMVAAIAAVDGPVVTLLLAAHH